MKDASTLNLEIKHEPAVKRRGEGRRGAGAEAEAEAAAAVEERRRQQAEGSRARELVRLGFPSVVELCFMFPKTNGCGGRGDRSQIERMPLTRNSQRDKLTQNETKRNQPEHATWIAREGAQGVDTCLFSISPCVTLGRL